MVTVTLTDCPAKLRGDLSKWLMEINTGVYVGKVNARVREELWKRICDNIIDGRATMIFSANNEQGIDFHIYNTTWQAVDYEGIKLIKRPIKKIGTGDGGSYKKSKASINRIIQKKTSAEIKKKNSIGYVVIDVETTGLDSESDEIIELAAMHIVESRIEDKMSVFVKIENNIPENITMITGISNEDIQKDGVELSKALDVFFEFINGAPLVSHNISFDRSFINEACIKVGRDGIKNVCKDTLSLARRRIKNVEDYKLKTLVEYFGIKVDEAHRALADCNMTYMLYEKLNEL